MKNLILHPQTKFVFEVKSKVDDLIIIDQLTVQIDLKDRTIQ